MARTAHQIFMQHFLKSASITVIFWHKDVWRALTHLGRADVAGEGLGGTTHGASLQHERAANPETDWLPKGMATTFDPCLIYHTQHLTFEPRHTEISILNKPKDKPNRSSLIDGLLRSSKALHYICVNMESVFEQDTERCVWVDASISGPLAYTGFHIVYVCTHTATGRRQLL